MNLRTFLRRRVIHAHAREIGRKGGKARAAQMRAPIIQRTKALRAELGLGEDARLA